MTLEEFTDFLNANGVSHKITYQSIVLSDCPHCGSQKDKIYLFKSRKTDSGPFFGKCMKCETKTNSYALLLHLGFAKDIVSALHGRMADGVATLRIMPSLDLFGDRKPAVALEASQPIEPVDISMFIPIPEIMQHPVAQYAINRGWTEFQTKDMLVDYFSSAVVFVVREGDKVVGYQRRFIRPVDPKFKTMSSKGFLKRRFVMEFPNKGDICIAEGPFTALSAWHYGYHAICTFGSNVGDSQLDRISDLALTTSKNVAIAFDLDDAGRKGYRKIRNAMYWRGVEAYRIKPEYGNDLNDSFLAKKGVTVIKEDEDLVLDAINLPFSCFE